MREIKFRAWHKDERLMCDVDVLNINDGAFLIGVKPEEDYLVDGGKTWVVAPENGRYCGIDEIELMQFTGLKDSSGVEIYEGDICRFYKCEDESCFFHGLALMNNNVVGGQWKIIKCDNVDSEIPSIKGEDCLDSSAFWNDDFEVIGNIHENKDLLK